MAIGLLICSSVHASQPGPHGPRDWQSLREKNISAGCSAEQVDQTLGACRRYGMSVREADELLAPVYAAQSEQLPSECICARIEEGLAKKVDIERVSSAAQSRLEHLREAQVLVSSVLSGLSSGHGDGAKRLLANVGLALESGLPDEVLKRVIQHNGHNRLGRLAHVVELGESLHLGGLEPQQVQRIMIDVLDRNLSRHEMLRAVEVLKEGVASGRDFESVYAELWVVPIATE